jgi:hypothetical protein
VDAVNWLGLAVKKIKAETVKKYFAKAGFEENDMADNLEVTRKTLLQYLISAKEKNLFVIQRTLYGVMTSLDTHYSFETATPATSLINWYVSCNMILMDYTFFFAILYNAEIWPM